MSGETRLLSKEKINNRESQSGRRSQVKEEVKLFDVRERFRDIISPKEEGKEERLKNDEIKS
jgi:hypothetical protein